MVVVVVVRRFLTVLGPVEGLRGPKTAQIWPLQLFGGAGSLRMPSTPSSISRPRGPYQSFSPPLHPPGEGAFWPEHFVIQI